MAKAKKELGYDKQGIKKSMRLRDYMADGCGQAGMNLIMAIAGQATYFYTEKVGVAAAVVSAVMFISKIVDAFTDLPMGRMLDKYATKDGKCRPWFKRIAVPSCLAIILLFSVPRNVPQAVQFIYLLVTNILLSAVVYTAFSVSYGAIVALRTESAEERGNMNISRSIFAYFFGAAGTITIIPVTNMLGGVQSAWIKYSVVAGLFCMLMMLILYKYSRETSKETETEQEKAERLALDEKERSVTLWQGLKMSVQNRAWVLALLASICQAVTYGLSNNSTYYAKYVYGNDNLVAVSGAVGMLGMLAGFILAKPILKKFGLSKTIIIANSVTAVPLIIKAFFPYAFWMNTILGSIGSAFSIANNAACSTMGVNAVAFNLEKYGMRLLGASGLGGFAYKVGNGLGAALPTFILALTGYNAALAAQSQSVIYGIFTSAIYIPIALHVFLLVIAVRYIPYEKRYYEIIRERNAAAMAKNGGQQ